MELRKIKGDVYYIPNSTNIGVIDEGNNCAVLIDTGIDSDTAKRIHSTLAANKLNVIAVINTHFHADHCGGNAYFERNGMKNIYAPKLESKIIQSTELEPMMFFSGACPISELNTKFLKAEISDVKEIDEAGDGIHMFGIGKQYRTVPLAGHSPNQMGIEVDGVLFCADSVFSDGILSKHKIPYFTDIGKAKESMRRLEDSNHEWYVPSHGEPVQDIKPLVEKNRAALESIESYIKGLLSGYNLSGLSAETIMAKTMNGFGIEIDKAWRYYLMKPVIMAFLSYMKDKGDVEIAFSSNELLWRLR